jgi:predicted phage terminase large subunit-like protein
MVEGIGIESNSYQMAMAQELKRSSSLPIHKIKTSRDKISRAMRRSALFENGKVFFRKNMEDFEEQLLLFPDVEHDDLFDGFDFAVQISEKGSRVKVHDRKHFNI